MPRRPDFFWHTLPAPEHDLRRRLKDFETKAQVQERAKHLVRVLKKGNRQQRRLARRLERCRKGKRCCAVVCPRCRRRWRLWCVGEKLRLLKDREDLSFVTLIPPDLRLGRGELEGFEPHRFVERLRRQMQRAGLAKIAVMGGVDVSWEEDGNGEGVWQPHLHLIVAGCEAKEIREALARHYPRTAEVRQPLKIQKVKDAVRQFSYCLKPFWQRRVNWTDTEGKRHRGPPLGLKPEQQKESVLFGAKLRPSELLFYMV